MTPETSAASLPAGFHLMAKPRGSICNLRCEYCYFLSKTAMYPESRFHMSDEVLEDFTSQYISAQRVPQTNFGWQGGEPTLLGIEFYEKAVELQREIAPDGMQVTNALQTNGTLLDDDWCKFLKKNDFLVGISIDGPRDIHDRYRVDGGGNPTFDRVMTGLELLKKHQVEFNVLTTVHAGNEAHGLEVYRFLREQLGSGFIQFIPVVERDNDTGFQEGTDVTARSVSGPGYGQFMIDVFEEWVRRDVGQIFVQLFDASLAGWVGHPPGLCIFAETCGDALVVEHNGDVYSCDHYVEPEYLLGNLTERPLVELLVSPQQREFGRAKADTLPRQCLECDVRFVCNGGCPKNRFTATSDGEPGLNFLCEGYRSFFGHIRSTMEFMANELQNQRAPANVMAHMKKLDARPSGAGRNQPCPCGSGTKFKHCHGRNRPG